MAEEFQIVRHSRRRSCADGAAGELVDGRETAAQPVVSCPPLSAFDYDLPERLIAQFPSERRDAARLMVLDRATAEIDHRYICDLPLILQAGDLLVLNDTRVLPARLLGVRQRTGGRWEGLYLGELASGSWRVMCRTRGRLEPGEFVIVPSTTAVEADTGELQLRLVEKLPDGHWRVEPSTAGAPAEAVLCKFGRTPLPPYIRKGIDRPEDSERYQTVYARRPGAVAAPTAGLHFTPELLERLTMAGIQTAFVTLHVGAGTFQPIDSEELDSHRMHEEWGELPAAAAEQIHRCRKKGGRIVAVGTTVARVLETAAAEGYIRPWAGLTGLFIRPPYQFRAVDVLLTNFHLPRSSLLVLVGAFAGISLVHRAYRKAILEGYRFYSYGDAMLIL